jgi:hypothetical protein
MRLREINLSLSSLDVLEPNLVLKIDAAYYPKTPKPQICNE